MNKLYITFGTAHIHRVNGTVYDSNCVAEIDCETEEQGREIAFDAFGPKFAFSYFNEVPRMSYCHRGLIPLEVTDE